jgi:hypothetical protein
LKIFLVFFLFFLVFVGHLSHIIALLGTVDRCSSWMKKEKTSSGSFTPLPPSLALSYFSLSSYAFVLSLSHPLPFYSYCAGTKQEKKNRTLTHDAPPHRSQALQLLLDSYTPAHYTAPPPTIDLS